MKSRSDDLLTKLALLALICLGSLRSASAASQLVAWGDVGQTFVPADLTNVVAIATAHFHNLSIDADGTLRAWPSVFYDPGSQLSPGLPNVVGMAAGLAHDLALRTDGTVVAWGDNTYGQTAVPAGLGDVVAVAAGGYYSLALTAYGWVVAWGDNSFGQLTIPTTATNVVAIAAGFYHSVALRADGTIICWGDDSFGQTDVPAGLTNVVAVSAGGDHCLALTLDGRVAAWGDDSYGQSTVPADLTNAVAVASGDYHSLALRSDGTVVAWGPHEDATAVPTGVSNVVAIAAGGSHSLALEWAGPGPFIPPIVRATTFCGSAVTLNSGLPETGPLSFQWSFNGTNLVGATHAELTLNDLQTNQTGIYSVVASNPFGPATTSSTLLTVSPAIFVLPPLSQLVFAGTTANFGMAALSTVPLSYQWQFNGTNISGATGTTLVLSNLIPTQQGAYTMVLSNAYGTVASADANLSVIGLVQWWDSGLTGINVGNVVELSSDESGCVLVSRADGTVAGWGGTTTPPADLTNIVAVATGYDHALALRSDGTVVAWGSDFLGQTDIPPDLTNVVAIAAGNFHSLALRANGTVAAWGDDFFSRGATEVPLGLTNVVAIAAGTFAGIAITSDGQVVVWGSPDYSSQANIMAPPGLNGVVQVAAGASHVLALAAGGTVVAWGDNSDGQTNVPAGLTNVVSIAADQNGSFALTGDGRVVAWGLTYAGKVLASLSNVVAIAAGGPDLALIGSGPPHLSAPLVSRRAAIGATTSFRAAATGLPPLGYQWQFGGTNLPGATNPVLTLTNVEPKQAGAYSVTVSNLLGVASSEQAALSVASPLLIDALTVQPYEQTAYISGTASFSVEAQGQGLTYQWFTNGVAIPGATNSALTLPNVQPDEAASYSVRVSNPLGQLTSRSVTLDVVPIWVQRPPSSQTNYPGGTAGFYPIAQGSPPLSYQWLFNGTNLPGATGASLSLTGVIPEQSGSYSVTVSNAYGVVTTPEANLVVLDIAEWPANSPGPVSFLSIPSQVTLLAASDAGWGLATKADGTVVALPGVNPAPPPIPVDLTNVIALGAGWLHALALRANGTVSAWGDNSFGQTNVPSGVTDVVSIAAGAFHNLALKADGTVVSWGANIFGQANVPKNLTNIVGITAGTNDSLALSRDGQVFAWGADNLGHPITVPPDLTNVLAVVSRGSLFPAIRNDGSLAVWQNSSSEPPYVPLRLSNIIAIAACSDHDLELTAAGTVISWANPSNAPAGVFNVVAIAAGGTNNFALLSSGPPVVQVLLSSPVTVTNGFAVEIPTQSGRVYSLEYKDSLAETNWKPLPLVAGNGNLRTLTDPTGTGALRFYRVRRW
jgi:alpha-tubulin suppressor-like RCC1 family protein